MTPSAAPHGPNAIVLVAGGTGGHVFPAEALAQELRARGRALALFTDQRGTAWSGALAGVPTHAISAGRVSGVGIARRLKGAAELALGGMQSRKLLAQIRPAVVVGFGGYVSVGPMMAAASLRLPTVIHEQNALLGRANRLLAPRVSAIATSFAEVARLAPRQRSKVTCTGNPVRDAVRALREQPYGAPAPDGDIELLVTGGSQGASVFARVVPDAVARLDAGLRARLRLAQQCRPEDIDGVRARYAAIGFNAELAPFFGDLAARLGRAHLVVCRAGASTVAELACAGRPAILVPYAAAADDHQSFNARALGDAGAAVVMAESAFTADALAAQLGELMAAAARAAGRPDAARRLAELVCRIGGVSGSNGDGGRQAA